MWKMWWNFNLNKVCNFGGLYYNINIDKSIFYGEVKLIFINWFFYMVLMVWVWIRIKRDINSLLVFRNFFKYKSWN